MTFELNEDALRRLMAQRASAVQDVLNATAHETVGQPLSEAAALLRKRLATVEVDMPVGNCEHLLGQLRAGEDVRIDLGG